MRWASEQQLSNLGIEPAVLLAIYKQMSRIHEVDKAMRAGLSSGRFQFTYWPMTGQEAIPATLATLTSTHDYMVTIYRGIHDQVAKGVPLKGLFAEAMARKDGFEQGQRRIAAYIRSGQRIDVDHGDRRRRRADCQRSGACRQAAQ